MTFLVNLLRTRPSGDTVISLFPPPLIYLIVLNRIQIGTQVPSIWVPLKELWLSVARVQSAEVESDSWHTQLVLCVAKFTRNLVADVPNNQRNAL